MARLKTRNVKAKRKNSIEADKPTTKKRRKEEKEEGEDEAKENEEEQGVIKNVSRQIL